MKRVSLFLAVVLLLCNFSIPVMADTSVTVIVNGQEVKSDAPARIINDRTMLPMRAILNALGVSNEEISWDQSSRSVQVNHGDLYIFLVVGNSGAVVNKQLIMMDTSPVIMDNRTLVPVRFLSETMGAKVDWNETDKKVTITK